MPTLLKEHVDRVLDSIRRAPLMWGSNEALEAQALALMEAEYYLLAGNGAGFSPVMTSYQQELRQRFETGVLPLSEHIDDPEEFATTLYEICLKVRTSLMLI